MSAAELQTIRVDNHLLRDKGYGIPDPMFKDRGPVAAARQLGTVLAWLTECELATLEELEGMTKTSRREKDRHRSICSTAVRHCHELGVLPFGLNGDRCGRLEQRLQQLKDTA